MFIKSLEAKLLCTSKPTGWSMPELISKIQIVSRVIQQGAGISKVVNVQSHLVITRLVIMQIRYIVVGCGP